MSPSMINGTPNVTDDAQPDAAEFPGRFLAAMPATLTLDRGLNIRGLSAELAEVLGLASGRFGGPLSETAPQICIDSLVDEARRVLATGVPSEREFSLDRGRWYLRRMIPFGADRLQPTGVAVAFMNITDRRNVAQALKESEDPFRTIFERAAAGIAQIARDGRFLQVNDAMCNMHGFTRDELLQRTYRDVIHPADMDSEVRQTQRALDGGIDTFSMEKRNLTKNGRVKWFHLTSATVRGEDGRVQYLVSVVEDITRRKETEEQLLRFTHELEREVDQRTRSVRTLQEIAVIANEADTVADAFEQTLQCVCRQLDWPVGHVWLSNETEPNRFADAGIWYLDDPDRFAPFVDATREISLREDEGTIGIVVRTRHPYVAVDVCHDPAFVRRAAAAQCEIQSGFAFPVLIRNDVVGVVEFFSCSGSNLEMQLVEGLAEFGTQLGRVVERRRLDKQIADATTHEQQLVGRELHDTVAQELTGLGMLGERLRIDLEHDRSAREPLAAEIVDHLTRVQGMVRRISHGLMPVDVAPEGLMAALLQLTEGSTVLYGVNCRFVCPQPVMVDNGTVSNQLYRIAQEAVHNAARHAKPQQIIVRLERQNQAAATMAVEDDGCGIDGDPEQRAGVGFRIMRHRALLANAEFLIQSRPGRGTTVSCAFHTRSEATVIL